MASMPPPPEAGNARGASPGPAADEDRIWAAVAHGGSVIAAWVALGILAPLIVLFVRGQRPGFVRANAIESLNFQLNALAWIAVGAVLVIFLVGLLVLAVVGLWYLVFVVLATLAALRGEVYRYPLIVRVIR